MHLRSQQPDRSFPESTRYFYEKDGRAVEWGEQGTVRVVWAGEALLALESKDSDRVLLAIDASRSLLGLWRSSQLLWTRYTPYGHRGRFEASHMGFNGQWLDCPTAGYLLGNGHRLYKPALMRFVSPDSLSPFGSGGRNAYAYCQGDPLNRTDPTGRSAFWLMFRDRVGNRVSVAPNPIAVSRPQSTIRMTRTGIQVKLKARDVGRMVVNAERSSEGVSIPLNVGFENIQTSTMTINKDGVVWRHTLRDAMNVGVDSATGRSSSGLKFDLSYEHIRARTTKLSFTGAEVTLGWWDVAGMGKNAIIESAHSLVSNIRQS